jgi:hypothetical protein
MPVYRKYFVRRAASDGALDFHSIGEAAEAA